MCVQSQYVFAEYVEVYEKMGRRADLQVILEASIERRVVREDQRVIWRTCWISVEGLSENSRRELNLMALFGQYEISKALLKEVVDCVRSRRTAASMSEYTNWVKGDLVKKARWYKRMKRMEGNLTIFIH